MAPQERRFLAPDRLAFVGLASLVPASLILAVDVAWWSGYPQAWSLLRPLSHNVLGGALIVLTALILPLVTVGCGIVALQRRGSRVIGAVMVFGGLLLILGNMAARPS